MGVGTEAQSPSENISLGWHAMVCCVCASLYAKDMACYPEFSHAVLDPLSLWAAFRIVGCCFSVVLQSCFCFSGRQFLLMRFGCILTLDVLPFPSWKTRPFPNTQPSVTHCGGVGILTFGGAAEWAKQSPKRRESHNSWGWKAPVDVQNKFWEQGHLSRLPKPMATWVFSIFNNEESATPLSSLFHCSAAGDLSGTAPATV